MFSFSTFSVCLFFCLDVYLSFSLCSNCFALIGSLSLCSYYFTPPMLDSFYLCSYMRDNQIKPQNSSAPMESLPLFFFYFYSIYGRLPPVIFVGICCIFRLNYGIAQFLWTFCPCVLTISTPSMVGYLLLSMQVYAGYLD